MKLFFLTAVALCAVILMSCTEQNTPSGGVDAAQLPVKEQQGVKIYLDPVTGKPSMPPAGKKPTSSVFSSDAKMNTSSRGLIEQSAPGGGTMVDLQGRFQSSTKATVNKDGSIVIEHLPTVQSSPLSGKE